jgi:hypothetical protein
MDFDELLKQQKVWIDKAGQAMKQRGRAGATELPLELRRGRIDGMRATVDSLTRQRDATLRRFDAAIADERNALKRLEAELTADEKASGAAKSLRSTSRRAAKAPKAKSK